MKYLKKLNTVVLFLIICLVFGGGFLNIKAEETDVIATVNGVSISKAEYYDILESQYGSYVLNELIHQQLIAQKVDDLGVEISEEDFAGFYNIILAQLGGPQGLQQFLAQNNATEEQFIEQLHWNVILSELTMKEVDVTDDKLIEWFEENHEIYDKPFTVEVSHILTENETEAQEILGLLEDGEGFAELASTRSIDTASGERGGFIGEIGQGDTIPEFEEAAFSLPVEEYGLVESGFGWHIVLVHTRNEPEKANFDDIKDLVEADYRADKALDAQSYLTKLELEADIEIFK